MARLLTLRVFGKVQGVFFRQSTKEKARELNLAGYVCNETDGTVYLEAEGEAADLVRLQEWCQAGPAGARVTRVEAAAGDPKGYTEFKIKR